MPEFSVPAEASSDFLRAFERHLATVRQVRGLPSKVCYDLHEARARIPAALREGGAGCGMHEVVRAHEGHFSARDSWKRYQRDCWHAPKPDTLYVHLDYKEHDQLPFGPTETNRSFYANYLQGVGFQGILSWSILSGRRHKFYLSKCKEQSGLYSQCALADCLTRVRAGRQRYRQLVVLVDSGRHYVCNDFMAYVLVHVPAQYTNLKEVSVAIAPAGHGKGAVDAEFAVCRSFRKFLRRKFWVNEVETYVSLLQERADALYDQCSLRPHREFIHRFPPPKAEVAMASLDDLQLRKVNMPIQSVFFWSSVLDKNGCRIVACKT